MTKVHTNQAALGGLEPLRQTPPCRRAPALEAGDVLFLPDLRFRVEPLGGAAVYAGDPRQLEERELRPGVGPAWRDHGERAGRGDAARVHPPVQRRRRRRWSAGLLPAYRDRVARGRASFRPAEIAGRQTTWRKDDTRLHVDSFPATPSGGRRILRVFSNVNPEGRARAWRLGDDFDAVARRFAPQLRVPLPGVGHLLALVARDEDAALGLRRADAAAARLHEGRTRRFSSESPQSRVDLPAGSTWLAFTDQVSHAATAGQYQLEQTFLLPVDAMHEPERSPLRVLERIKGRVARVA